MQKFPLTWPPSRPRTPANFREAAAFGKKGSNEHGWRTTKPLTIAQGITRLRDQLDTLARTKRHRVDGVVISTNLKLSRYSEDPLSDQPAPKDPGAAVYFSLDGRQYVFACDKWNKVQDNLAAIAAHLEAFRGIERWGVGELQDAFRGFAALPASTSQVEQRDPWDVLEMKPTSDQDKLAARYRKLAKMKHPDAPLGTKEAFQELQEAYEFLTEKLQDA